MTLRGLDQIDMFSTGSDHDHPKKSQASMDEDMPGYTDKEARLSQALKEKELDGHEQRKPKPIERARAYARSVAAAEGTVTADDIRHWCKRNDIEVGPWLGAVFRGKEWTQDGWTTSRDPKQHATGLRVWRHTP